MHRFIFWYRVKAVCIFPHARELIGANVVIGNYRFDCGVALNARKRLVENLWSAPIDHPPLVLLYKDRVIGDPTHNEDERDRRQGEHPCPSKRHEYKRKKKRGPNEEEGDIKRSEEHTSELQSQSNLVCRLL